MTMSDKLKRTGYAVKNSVVKEKTLLFERTLEII